MRPVSFKIVPRPYNLADHSPSSSSEPWEKSKSSMCVSISPSSFGFFEVFEQPIDRKEISRAAYKSVRDSSRYQSELSRANSKTKRVENGIK